MWSTYRKWRKFGVAKVWWIDKIRQTFIRQLTTRPWDVLLTLWWICQIFIHQNVWEPDLPNLVTPNFCRLWYIIITYIFFCMYKQLLKRNDCVCCYIRNYGNRALPFRNKISISSGWFGQWKWSVWLNFNGNNRSCCRSVVC